MKIAYIGIDLFFPALVALYEKGCEIAEIFTCQTDNVTEFNIDVVSFAKKHKIPYKTSRITVEDIARLRGKGCQAAVCGGYYYRIPVAEDFPIVNIHPSLLPMGRGPWPMPVSILRGDKKSGVTLHKIAEGFDTGDILIQREFTLSPDENLESFMEKASCIAAELMETLLENFDELWNGAKPQGEGEYLDEPSEECRTVSADMTVREADLILRAFYGYECFYGEGEKRIAFIHGRAEQGKAEGLPEIRNGYIRFEKIVGYKK